MNAPAYRICRKCGKKVNTSGDALKVKKYTCSRCTGEPWFMTREIFISKEKSMT